MEPIAVVVFDVNETLTDLTPLREVFVDQGLAAHDVQTWFASVLRDGFALSTVGDSAAFAKIGGELLHERLRDQASTAEQRSDAVAAILAEFGSLPVHSDVPGAVADLVQEDRSLITLSNGSVGVAAAVLQSAGLRQHFDALLSVEDAQIWKPAAGAYAYALSHGEWAPECALLVACHPWDLHGAHLAGLRTAWINRDGRSWPSYFDEPDLTVTDLRDLAPLLTGF